jgi:hypothetical protein
LTIDGNHDYFVIAQEYEYGQTCILVHNAIWYHGTDTKSADDIMKYGLSKENLSHTLLPEKVL